MSERTKAIVGAAVVLAVQVLGIWGVDANADELTSALLAFMTLAASVAAIWKNFNFTAEAAKAQAVLDHLKAERKAIEAEED